jgi:DNA-binding NarL/FixJ family response regulator
MTSGTSGTSILMVDDHQGFVDAVALYVSDEDDLRLVATAATAAEALDRFRSASCDVVVLAQAFLADGLDLVLTLLSLRAHLPIVLLVDGADEAESRDTTDLLGAVEAGIRGWVSRADGLDALLAAVRSVAHGESHVPTEEVRTLLAAQDQNPGRVDRVRTLTEREHAVLAALAAGLSRAEIGEALHLSPNTVRTHVRSILRKYHVHSAPDAVALLTRMESDHG